LEKNTLAKRGKSIRGENRDELRFEEFLQQQFSQVRAELDKYAPVRKGVASKLLQLPQAKATGSTFLAKMDSWRYGIAATVLLAVAIPSVIQLNRQQREIALATSPTTDSPTGVELEHENRQQSKDALRQEKDEVTDNKSQDLVATKRPTKGASKKQKASSKDLYVAEKEDRVDVISRRESPADAKSEAPASPTARSRTISAESAGAPAPAMESAKAPAALPTAPAPHTFGGAADEERVASESVARSAPIADAQFKLKQDQIAEDEKAEMERLWKEFENNPKSFNQDKKRSARLKTLLARHDTRSRAKKIRASEIQNGY
jgi:hypothetical protein